MAKYIYRIIEKFNNISIKDYMSYYKLGNEKLKDLRLNGKILINGNISTFESTLHTGDILELHNCDTLDIEAYDKKIDIIYEDDYLLILNKPVGVAIHSDGNQNTFNTLANMVANYYKKTNQDIPVRYLHRLDYDTSGIIIFCKDIMSMSLLSDLISRHELRRDYLALASGIYKGPSVINKAIGRDRHINGKYRVFEGGKEAITHVKLLDNTQKYSLVRLSLKTGRTHQIRVHMAYSGNPLLGDSLYGGGVSLIKRQALHSYYVEFKHPITNKLISKSVRPPYDMESLIKKMK